MAGISAKAAGSLVNNYKFNSSSELNNDLDIGLYETPLRGYDMQIGRFGAIDIMAEEYHSFSGYAFVGNNPIVFSDPSGAKKEFVALHDPSNDPAPGNGDILANPQRYNAWGGGSGFFSDDHNWMYESGNGGGSNGNSNGSNSVDNGKTYGGTVASAIVSGLQKGNISTVDVLALADGNITASMAQTFYNYVYTQDPLNIVTNIQAKATTNLFGMAGFDISYQRTDNCTVWTFYKSYSQVEQDFKDWEVTPASVNQEAGVDAVNNGLEFIGKTNDIIDATWKTMVVSGISGKIVNSGKAIGKYSGPAAWIIGATQVGYGIHQDGNKFGYNAQKATAGVVGGTIGAWVGFQAGAMAGFEAGFSTGLLFEGVGAIPGAIIGGVVGGFSGAVGGAYGGSAIGQSLITK